MISEDTFAFLITWYSQLHVSIEQLLTWLVLQYGVTRVPFHGILTSIAVFQV
jgi:hypothetical protein